MQVELVVRSPQELYEITCLIGELMPVLPSDGIFAIDGALLRPNASSQETLVWQWQGDRGVWHNYSSGDSRVIEVRRPSIVLLFVLIVQFNTLAGDRGAPGLALGGALNPNLAKLPPITAAFILSLKRQHFLIRRLQMKLCC